MSKALGFGAAALALSAGVASAQVPGYNYNGATVPLYGYAAPVIVAPPIYAAPAYAPPPVYAVPAPCMAPAMMPHGITRPAAVSGWLKRVGSNFFWVHQAGAIA